ncbi:glycosyltransferase 87 family protein [Williamsia sterculiae]|uniref:Alpha-1,2-mannosyltransferase n=1 Tax=Williamsia sterculiae TaxID=1344003 RepID=A0A1N7F6T9_9NOCA|nr:glycosyltransferase 87 family protein [Williamsia sterculiae]SIR96019.1 alpha-1,2-mannosyltransferase [Williamsia sterculiae]
MTRETTSPYPIRDLPRPTVVAVAFAVLGVLAVYLQHVIVPYDTPFWGLFSNGLDLGVYRDGARTVLDGQKLYEAKLLGVMDYTYTPISAVLFMPVALIPLGLARVLWTVAIFVALYSVIVLAFRRLGYRVTWQLRVVAVSLVVICTLLEPVRSTIWFGQVNVFLMLLILWDLLRDSARTRGIGVGIAAGIKLTPLVFVLYLLVVRRPRDAAVAVAGFVGTIVIGFVVLPGESTTYWSGTFLDSNRVGRPDTLGNQSIRGAIANLAHTPDPNVLLWIALAAVALFAGLYTAWVAHRHDRELLALSIVGITSAVVSPMSWGHHWVWVVPLLVIALDHVLHARTAPRGVLTLGAVLILLCSMLAWRTYLGHPILFIDTVKPDAYLTGLFFKAGPDWLHWYTFDPYNWAFVFVVVVTLVDFWWSDRRAHRHPGRADDRDVGTGDISPLPS